MVSVSRETVKRVAELARISLTDKELTKFSKELGTILNAFRDIEKVDTKNIKPSFQPLDMKNVTREDKTEPCLTRDQVMTNTRNKEKGYFKGPRIV